MSLSDAEASGASAAAALRMARLSFQAEQAQQLVPLDLLQQARQHIKVRAPNPPAPRRPESIDNAFWRGFDGVYNRVEREKLARQLLVGEQPELQDASQELSPLSSPSGANLQSKKPDIETVLRRHELVRMPRPFLDLSPKPDQPRMSPINSSQESSRSLFGLPSPLDTHESVDSSESFDSLEDRKALVEMVKQAKAESKARRLQMSSRPKHPTAAELKEAQQQREQQLSARFSKRRQQLELRHQLYRRLQTLPAPEVGQLMRCLSSDNLDDMVAQAVAVPGSPIEQLTHQPTVLVRSLEEVKAELTREARGLRPRTLPNVKRFARAHQRAAAFALQGNGLMKTQPKLQNLAIASASRSASSDERYKDELVNLGDTNSTPHESDWATQTPDQCEWRQVSQNAVFPAPRHYDPVENMFVPAGAGLCL